MNHNQKISNHLQKQSNNNDMPIMYIGFNGSKQLTVTQRINHIKDVLIGYMDDISLNELLLKTGSYFSQEQKNQLKTNIQAYSLWRKAGQPIKELTIPSESYKHIINRYKFRGGEWERPGGTDPQDNRHPEDPMNQGDPENQGDMEDTVDPNIANQVEPENSVYQANLELTNQLINLLTTSNNLTSEDVFISQDQLSFCTKPIQL